MIDLKHKNLDGWKLSIEVTAIIHAITQGFPKTEQFGLISQMRRASVSISSNIAEGAARFSAKERRRFYEIARSSLPEIDTQLEISCKLGFISQKENLDLKDTLNHLFAMLSNIKKIQSIRLPSHVCRLTFVSSTEASQKTRGWFAGSR